MSTTGSDHPTSEPDAVDPDGVDGDLEEHVLEFPAGIPGFPSALRWLLSDLVEDGAFQLMSNLDDPSLEMVVGVPWLFFPDYSPDLDDSEVQQLGITEPEDAVIFCSVTIGGGEADEAVATMNLLSPFVVNRHTRVGRQVVLDQDEARIRTPLPLGA